MLEIVGENVVASDVLGSWSWSRGITRTLCGLGLEICCLGLGLGLASV